MSVRNFLRRQTDVNHLASHSRSNSTSNASELERPLSEYDNIKPPTVQTHFPLGDIKFRFDDLPLTTKAIMNDSSNANSSAMHYNNKHDNQQTTTSPVRYENVLDTLQMRNKQNESDQQVKMNQNDERSPSRSVMSDAKSSFFGLNQHSSAVDEFDRLIEDIGNATIVSNDQNQYVNIPNESQSSSNHDKVSATSSASGSSSTTATPSASPTRQERTGSSRKNSEGSNRSKSPKFMLPEVNSPSSMSQVKFSEMLLSN